MYYHLARSRFIYYLLAHSFTLIKIVKKATKALRRREPTYSVLNFTVNDEFYSDLVTLLVSCSEDLPVLFKHTQSLASSAGIAFKFAGE